MSQSYLLVMIGVRIGSLVKYWVVKSSKLVVMMAPMAHPVRYRGTTVARQVYVWFIPSTHDFQPQLPAFQPGNCNTYPHKMDHHQRPYHGPASPSERGVILVILCRTKSPPPPFILPLSFPSVNHSSYHNRTSSSTKVLPSHNPPLLQRF